jgi:hypothetical protein
MACQGKFSFSFSSSLATGDVFGRRAFSGCGDDDVDGGRCIGVGVGGNGCNGLLIPLLREPNSLTESKSSRNENVLLIKLLSSILDFMRPCIVVVEEVGFVVRISTGFMLIPTEGKPKDVLLFCRE